MATTKKQQEYYEGIGRRKRSVARVRIIPNGKGFIVNDKPLEEFFLRLDHQLVAREALALVAQTAGSFGVSAHVSGGGISSQAESIRLGIARALVKIDATLRPELKHAGFLKRDPRQVERKKFGLKKARKAAQWSKR